MSLGKQITQSHEIFDGQLLCPGAWVDVDGLNIGGGQQGAEKQYFPVYCLEDFNDSLTTLAFRVDDFIVARQDGQIVGVIGLWDQSSYKQTIVQAYHNWLHRLRPVYNVGLRLAGARPLPPPGQPIHFAYASFICIANNDSGIFRALLRHAYNLAAGRGYPYLMLGLSERDPLLRAPSGQGHFGGGGRVGQLGPGAS